MSTNNYPNLSSVLVGSQPQDLVNVIRILYDNVNSLKADIAAMQQQIAALQTATKAKT
jgi:prefoldin subunit 5